MTIAPTPIPINPSTQQDFLDLLTRLLPASFLDPIQNVGPGYELYQAAASAMQRVSQGVAILDRAAFISTSSSGGLATALVQFARPTAAAGAVTISVGTVVSTSKTGRQYILQQAASLTASGVNSLLSTPVLVQAVAESYEFNNALGPIITAANELILGDIDTINALITVPDYADPTIVVQQYADASGGSMDDLDQIGRDQDMPRQPGESDAHYRARLRQLPDVVSPGAIQRAVAAFFQQFAPFGSQYAQTYYIETWACGVNQVPAQLTFNTAWDIPNAGSLPAGNPFTDLSLNTAFFYDDTRGPGDHNIPNASGYYGRWMDYGDYRGAFIIVCPNLPCINDQGMFFDDPSPNPIPGTGQPVGPIYATPLGGRGVSGFDCALLPSPDIQGFFDGTDLAKISTYSALDALLNQIKAGGVEQEIVVFGWGA